MSNTPLWKYCDAGQRREMLLSLQLLDRTVWPDDKYLACLYALSNHPDKHYQAVRIPKRDGTMRQLYQPDPLLKQVQKQILHRILEQLPVASYATAYQKGGGIRENALPHHRKNLILKLDIKNFFDHVMFYMVYQYAFPAVCFPVPVRTLLANLCCYKECLPQGAPTSAYISNLVLKSFDESIGAWCEEREITYTRYCDDITCSGDFSPGVVIRKISAYLQELGFYLNDRKTRIISGSQSQIVTGITVNEKLQVPRDYRKELRKELYYCKTFGVISHLQHIKDSKYLPQGAAGVRRYLQSLLGRVNFICYINPEDAFFLNEISRITTWMAELEDSGDA